MFKRKIKFKNSRGLTLAAIFEGKDKDAPVVVMCHGFGSSKDSDANKDLSQKILNRGLSVFRFDFTGCGQSQGKLEQLTPLAGLDDLKSAIEVLGRKQFALYGNSFGGYTALLYAGENPVLALGLKAPVSYYPDVSTVENAWQNYGFTKGIKNNFLAEVKNIDLYQKTRNITAPTLIVHGDRDEIVPLKESRKLIESLKSQKKLVILKGAPHVIRGEYMERANSLLADFFKAISSKEE